MTRMGSNGRGLDDGARRTRRARRDEEGTRWRIGGGVDQEWGNREKKPGSFLGSPAVCVYVFFGDGEDQADVSDGDGMGG